MKLTKQSYRDTANHVVPAINSALPSYAKRTQHVSYTRVPPGAWVEMWVWVPKAYAVLHKTKETSNG